MFQCNPPGCNYSDAIKQCYTFVFSNVTVVKSVEIWDADTLGTNWNPKFMQFLIYKSLSLNTYLISLWKLAASSIIKVKVPSDKTKCPTCMITSSLVSFATTGRLLTLPVIAPLHTTFRPKYMWCKVASSYVTISGMSREGWICIRKIKEGKK